jgi:hypothetical protein
LSAKAGHIDYILPFRFQLISLAKQQYLTPVFNGQYDPAADGQEYCLSQYISD